MNSKIEELLYDWEYVNEEYDDDALCYCAEEIRRVLRIIESEEILKEIIELEQL